MARKKQSADKDVPKHLGTAETTPVTPVLPEDPPLDAEASSESEILVTAIQAPDEAPTRYPSKKRQRKTLATDTQQVAETSREDSPVESTRQPQVKARKSKTRSKPAEEQLQPAIAQSDEPETNETISETQPEVSNDPAPKKRKRKALSKEAQVLADALPAESLTESAGGEHQDEAEPEALPQPNEEELEPVAAEAADTESASETTELKLVPAEEAAESETTPEASEEEEPDFIDPDAPEITTQQVVEAIMFVSDTALTLPKIVSMLGVGSARDVKKYIEELNQRYIREGATFRIEKIAGGYQMLTLPQFNTWLRRLRESKQDSRFSAAALETLSVVAYKQPVTRADIEAIRGVAAGEMLNRLRELNLVKIVGRAEDVGRPMLYGTTKRFLEVFGLASLDDLPQVEQMQIAQ